MPFARIAYRLGSTIGLAGGAAFVLINRQSLPSAPAWAALLAWIVLLALAVWRVWLRPGPVDGLARPRPRAGAIYGAACVGMVLLMALGSRVLTAAGVEHAVPALVVTAVGLHFLPFSYAFAAPFFVGLGTLLAFLGALGLILALTLGAPWGAGFAVLAGLVMTGLVALGPRRH